MTPLLFGVWRYCVHQRATVEGRREEGDPHEVMHTGNEPMHGLGIPYHYLVQGKPHHFCVVTGCRVKYLASGGLPRCLEYSCGQLRDQHCVPLASGNGLNTPMFCHLCVCVCREGWRGGRGNLPKHSTGRWSTAAQGSCFPTTVAFVY